MKIERDPNYIKPCKNGIYGWYADPEMDYQVAYGNFLPERDLYSHFMINDRPSDNRLHTFQAHAETRNLR
jgi:hypothetical protein